MSDIQDYIAKREARSPEFKALREASEPEFRNTIDEMRREARAMEKDLLILERMRERADEAHRLADDTVRSAPELTHKVMEMARNAEMCWEQANALTTAIAIIKAAKEVAENARQVTFGSEDTVLYFTVDADTMAELHALLTPTTPQPDS